MPTYPYLSVEKLRDDEAGGVVIHFRLFPFLINRVQNFGIGEKKEYLDIKQEGDYISILDDVVFTFCP